MEDLERVSNKAADTGSAAHLAVRLWHEQHGADAALKMMRDSIGTFQEADLDEAEAIAKAYFRDPKNYPEVCVAVETKVCYSIPPHPWDETKKKIFIEGTADQLRYENGMYSVWDYKTGDKDSGWVMLHEFAPQLAGYTIGIEKANTVPGPLTVGGIIRGRGYFNRGKLKDDISPDGVFFESGQTLDDCRMLLARLQFIVAGIRSGESLYGPGNLCGNCPHGGLGNCLSLGRGLGLRVIV